MEECQYLDEELDGLVAEIQEKFDDLKKTDKKLTASARTDKVEFQPRQHQLTLTPTLTLTLALTLTRTQQCPHTSFISRRDPIIPSTSSS